MSAKKSKAQKRVSISENNQIRIEWNQYSSSPSIKKVSNWDLSLQIICQTERQKRKTNQLTWKPCRNR